MGREGGRERAGYSCEHMNPNVTGVPLRNHIETIVELSCQKEGMLGHFIDSHSLLVESCIGAIRLLLKAEGT